MKKISLFLLAGIFLCVVALHFFVGSGPFQRKILTNLKNGLLTEGIVLEIESFDFSLLTQKLYLNRVTLQGTENSELRFEHPLEVDKIKIELQLLGLLFKEIVFEEVALYHPKIIIPQADSFYRKIARQLDKRKRIEIKGGGWPIVFKRVGIVDSQFEVTAANPSFSIRSRNLSVFLSQTAVGQQSIEIKSNHFELKRDLLELDLNRLDGDIDFTEKSVRANRLIVEGKGIKLNWKGAFSIPSKDIKKRLSFHLSHETEIDLSVLNSIQELKVPQIGGLLKSGGTLHVANGKYLGSGNVEVSNTAIDDAKLGNWIFSYQAEESEVLIKKVSVGVGGGTLSSDLLKISLDKKNRLEGLLRLEDVQIRQIASSFSQLNFPLDGVLSGEIKLTSEIDSNWSISLAPKIEMRNIIVVVDPSVSDSATNRVIAISQAKVGGIAKLTNGIDGHNIDLDAELLGGQLKLAGQLVAREKVLKFKGENLDLQKLGPIAQIPFEGTMDVEGQLLFPPQGDVDIASSFGIKAASISEIELGPVRGKLQYTKQLLSFSKLEIKALESARGQGFVDFSPKDTVYRFDVSAPRMSMNQVWSLFSRNPLPVEKPVGGEIGARVVISGGGQEEEDLNVKVTGQARSFEWYGEKWMSASIGLSYSPQRFFLEKGVFLKRSGSLEAKAQYSENKQELQLYSSGMRLEDLNHLKSSPLQGELTGRLVFEGDLKKVSGNGEVLLNKLEYQGRSISDAKISLKSVEGEQTLSFSIPKEEFEVVWKRTPQSSVFVKGKKADFAPYLSAWLGKDISPLNHMRLSGEGTLRGKIDKPELLVGQIKLSEIILDFGGQRIKSKVPAILQLNSEQVEIAQLQLVGGEAEALASFSLKKNDALKASLKGRVPLGLLQPFIPSLDYASGWVNANIQASGPPERYNLFGTISLVDSSFRFQGMQDDFKAVNTQLTLDPNQVTIQSFQSRLGNGDVSLTGNIQIDRFSKFSPRLNIFLAKSTLKLQDYLKTTLTGDLTLTGEKVPFLLKGRVQVDELVLTDLSPQSVDSVTSLNSETLLFDIDANAKDGLFVKTDILNGQLSGSVKVVGNDQQIGLIGKAEVLDGQVFFKDTAFDIVSGGARFEKSDSIYPRFNINARSIVREQRGRAYQDYEVNLQALGTPEDYKIRLTSNPPLVEQDLISLLVLGVTTQGQEGNYFDLGTAIMGQSPIRSKIQSELGVDIKVQSAPGQGPLTAESGASSAGTGGATGLGSGMVPAFRIEKGLTKSTKLSYSNTLDQNQARELRVEQMLDNNITLNATAGDRSRNNSQARPGDSFGVDIRYRFSFE